MSKKSISLSPVAIVSNSNVGQACPGSRPGKVSLFKGFVLAVFILAAGSLFMAMPAAYGEEAHAMEFSTSLLTINDDDDVLRLGSYTYELWMKDLDGPTGSWRNVFCKGPGDTNAGRGPLMALRPSDPGLHFSHSTGSGHETVNSLTGIPVNGWIHIALVLTALNGEQIVYQDGVEVARESVSNATAATQSAVLRIGLGAHVILDEFRVWNYARTREEIQADMKREITGIEKGLVGYWRFNEAEGTIVHDMSLYENHGTIATAVWTTDAAPIAPGKPPVVASHPNPGDGEVYLATWVNLSWRPGDLAVSHDVYLGESFDDINNATVDAPVYRGNQSDAFMLAGVAGYPYPDGLVPGTTYYWRVDEVNNADPNSPWKGPVWSFRIPRTDAYAPSPADGSLYVGLEPTLTWEPGFGAKLHYVVFGDNRDEVTSAAAGTPVTTTSFTPGTLKKGKTYYWRVDEFSPPTTVKGEVWSFSTLLDIPITDPNQVGWWKFDEDTGTTAVDSSGYDNYGTLRGDPQWTGGFDGSALSFDGVDDFVEIPHAEILTVDNEVTVMAWIHTSRHGGPDTQGYQGIIGKGNPPRSYNLYTQSAGTLHFSTTSAGAYVGSSSSSQVPLNEWVHVCAQVIGGQHQYYINGESAGTGGGGITLPGATDTATVVIARTHEGSTRSFLGMIDDVRIYNRALTQDEIRQVMRGDVTRAWNPSPANASTPDIAGAATLTWSPGEKASQHAVYFGTDRDIVAAADSSDTTGVFRGLQAGTSYVLPDALELGSGPYYWRIDEVNTDGSVTPGTIWSFSVADYILVDDFESYNDIPAGQAGSNLVYVTWLDGYGTTTNGSAIGYLQGASLETANVHGGAKAAPLIYDNSGTAAFSEIERTFAAQDWTSHGVQTLSLWFYGDATNVPGQLYAKINGIKVLYNGDANNLKQGAWQSWNIDLASVAVNLQSVTRLAIGIETKGAKGTLLLDDIRLYRPTVTP